MKTYQRVLALLLALMMLLMVGCGGNTTDTEDEDDSIGHSDKEDKEDEDDDTGRRPSASVEDTVDVELTDEPITITFYHCYSTRYQAVLDEAIEDFNRIYPNITVEHRSCGGYDDLRNEIATEITGGTQPNLAVCYPDHVAYYSIANAVLPLDGYIADEKWGFTDKQIADFVPAFYEEGRCYGDDKMYSLPLAKSTEVLYYNKTFFEENGLAVPTTWDEMEAVCERIKQIDPSCIPLAYDSESNWFITMCEQYGSDYTSATGDKFLFNNETNRNFVERFRQWYEKKWVTTQSLAGGYSSSMFTGESFTRCYMSIASTGGATYQQPNQVNGKFEFEVGITSIPQVDPSNPKVISQGASICVFRNGDQQEELASWLFARFLSTNAFFQTELSMSNGYMPVIQSVLENRNFMNYLGDAGTANITAYAVKVALEQKDAYYVSPAFYGSSVARDQVGLLMQKCLPMTGSDVAKKIKNAFEDAVAECKYQVE